MSLKTRLIWAFVSVTAVGLVLSFVGLNVGMYSSMMGAHGMAVHMMGYDPTGMSHWLNAVMQFSLVSSLAALALAGLIGYFTADRITRSVRHLRNAAQYLDLRDLSRRVPVEGADEIGDLARTFNRMCDRLQTEERARRQLLADVAHELRHPLAVMQGRLDLMADGKVPLEPEALVPLDEEVARLARLVGDLRDLSLAEVGGLSLHRRDVAVDSVLTGLLANLEPVAAAREITLTADLASDLPVVQADPDRLRQMLVNLIVNALQYTGPGGQVTVTARRQAEGSGPAAAEPGASATEPGAGGSGGIGPWLAVTVRDTGPGIAAEDLPHIFDRFYRADPSRSRTTGGSGLGLAIVRSLAELHGGKITVQSRLGEGSVFTLFLPGQIMTK